MNPYWSDTAKRSTPYQPGKQPGKDDDIMLKLNTNENPFPPSTYVLDALRRALNHQLHCYPDPNATLLCQCIAGYYGLKPGQVLVGNGSDEVLALAFQALLKQPRPILFPDITYGFYSVFCALYGIPYQTIPLDSHYQIRVDDYLGENGGIIFPNPNAPTGGLLPLSEIIRLLEGNRATVVVLDEAYIDFGGQSAVELIDKYPNLLVIQTLSKSRSLAGLRVGVALGEASLIEGLRRIKDSFNPYPLDRLAIAGATAAFEDHAYFEKNRLALMANRAMLSDGLARMGFEVLPSAANFVFASHALFDAKGLTEKLHDQGILVRHFDLPRITQFLRVSVGTEIQCRHLLRNLSQLVCTEQA